MGMRVERVEKVRDGRIGHGVGDRLAEAPGRHAIAQVSENPLSDLSLQVSRHGEISGLSEG
jgi:hypothetical protein